jgi:prevent-host-death family protein
VALAEVKDDLSKYLRLAVDEEIVITRHGRPAGILIGFASEEDWFEYRLEHTRSLCVASRRRASLFAVVIRESHFETCGDTPCVCNREHR